MGWVLVICAASLWLGLGVEGSGWEGKAGEESRAGICDLLDSRSPDLRLLGAMNWSSYVWIKEFEQWCFELGDTRGDDFMTALSA